MHTQSLINLLRHPESSAQLAEGDWNAIVLAARQNQLLGALAAQLPSSPGSDAVPEAVKRHLHLELLTAQRRSESALWELGVIRQTISADVDLVVLKGCAYVAAADANHAGRIFSDLDVLVDRRHLQRVETELIGGGWKPGKVNAYDDVYYRNWMHEVPPMEHVRRHTVLDLHHAINPPVADNPINSAMLLARKVEISPGLFVLAPLDRVIHCAIHLIQEGEPKKLLRDLYDLHQLLEQHCVEKPDLQRLLTRSRELGVGHLVSAAVGAAGRLFAVPTGVMPSTALQRCMVIAAQNAHVSGSAAGWMAGTAVLIHSHWIKMPLRLLVPHLCRKSFQAVFAKTNDANKDRES